MQQNTVTNKLARLIVIVMLIITITSIYAHASSKNNAGLPGWIEISGGYQVSASFLLNPTDPSLLENVILQLSAEPGSPAVKIVQFSLDNNTGWVQCTSLEGSLWVCDMSTIEMRISEIVILRAVVN